MEDPEAGQRIGSKQKIKMLLHLVGMICVYLPIASTVNTILAFAGNPGSSMTRETIISVLSTLLEIILGTRFVQTSNMETAVAVEEEEPSRNVKVLRAEVQVEP